MIARNVTRTAGALVMATSAAALLAGCPPCGQRVLESWQFERCNDGATCGWTALRGTVSPEETLLPGEHGIRLAPETEIEQQLEVTLPGVQSTESVSMIARCDPGTGLRVDQYVNETLPAQDGGTSRDAGTATAPGTPPIPQLRRATGDARPGAEWAPVSITLSAVSGATLPPLGPRGTATRVAFSLRVATVGPGACVIDAVQYNTLGGGFCE